MVFISLAVLSRNSAGHVCVTVSGAASRTRLSDPRWHEKVQLPTGNEQPDGDAPSPTSTTTAPQTPTTPKPLVARAVVPGGGLRDVKLELDTIDHEQPLSLVAVDAPAGGDRWAVAQWVVGSTRPTRTGGP